MIKTKPEHKTDTDMFEICHSNESSAERASKEKLQRNVMRLQSDEESMCAIRTDLQGASESRDSEAKARSEAEVATKGKLAALEQEAALLSADKAQLEAKLRDKEKELEVEHVKKQKLQEQVMELEGELAQSSAIRADLESASESRDSEAKARIEELALRFTLMQEGLAQEELYCTRLRDELQKLQARFFKYRELAAQQASEASALIKELECHLDDCIFQSDLASRKAQDQLHQREQERLEAARRLSEALRAAARPKSQMDDTEHEPLQFV